MTVEYWDPDQAVTFGPIDEDLEATCSIDRYGVTGEEEIRGEPLSVALSQEEPDIAAYLAPDDQWLLVDDAQDYRLSFNSPAQRSPEELALHVESL
jgi:hypothetical protein